MCPVYMVSLLDRQRVTIQHLLDGAGAACHRDRFITTRRTAGSFLLLQRGDNKYLINFTMQDAFDILFPSPFVSSIS